MKMQNLNVRIIPYTPGGRSAASSKQKTGYGGHKKTALQIKSRFRRLGFDESVDLFNINANLLGSFFLRFGDFDSENPILEVC
jgi:hypothetical protein